MTTIERSPIDLPAALTSTTSPSLPGSTLRARAALADASADYLAIPDSALLRTWLFRGIDTEDGVRYGIYRGAETVEAASAELVAALAGARARAAATIRTAPATIARWALQGRLAALGDDVLDRVAKEGEWTVRETLAHTIAGQRSYGWFSRWWLSQPLGPDRPSRVPDEVDTQSQRELPSDEAEGRGSLADIRSRLDAVLDEWALRYANLDSVALGLPARWAGVPGDIDFRLGRWASHIAEHTVQLDKTLAWLGYEPSEAARIVRDLYTAWGRLEAQVFPVAPAGTEGAVDSILERMAATLVSEARDVREAAGA
ncbi:MAG: DinB family protein [Chloroflexi bacterium]|nr:MAG: DinB family protein [Chloroflexota bacterium]